MRYKAIFFDIDGTLMDSNTSTIPSSTIDALHQLQKQNIQIFVATSRCDGEFGNFTDYLNQLHFDGIISCGGAMMKYHGKTIQTEIMNSKDVHAIINYCEEHQLSIRYQSDINCHLHETPSKPVYDSFIYFYDYCPDVKKYDNENVVNLLGFGTPKDYEAINALCEDVDGVCYDDAFEFTKKGVNKAYGMHTMCEQLGIDIENIIAFGDAENDIAMLKEAGLGIAMGNACEECKKAADFITKRCENDGIAYALEYFQIIDGLHLSDNELHIRQAEEIDIDVLYNWWNDGKVMAHAGFPNGLHKTKDAIKQEIKANSRTKRRLILFYEDMKIGEMSFVEVEKDTYDFGIKICEEDYQNKHYGPRFLRLLFDYLFDVLKAKRIILDTDLENKRAQKVYERLGFINKEIHYDSWINDIGEKRSSVSYSMTIDDYRR